MLYINMSEKDRNNSYCAFKRAHVGGCHLTMDFTSLRIARVICYELALFIQSGLFSFQTPIHWL